MKTRVALFLIILSTLALSGLQAQTYYSHNRAWEFRDASGTVVGSRYMFCDLTTIQFGSTAGSIHLVDSEPCDNPLYAMAPTENPPNVGCPAGLPCYIECTESGCQGFAGTVP